MNLSLKNREWGEFYLGDIFNIYSSSSGIDKNKLILKNGNTPYITRSEKNNGIDLFLCKQNNKYKEDNSNVIIIGLDTQTVFYQPFEFYTGQNIQILESDKINKHTALFLIPLIKIQLKKFSWGGNGATLSRLKKSKILLPINGKGEPDYASMEAYIREKEQKKLKKYKLYVTKRINELKKVKKIVPLAEKEWGEFYLGDIFLNIQRGKRLKKAEHKRGKMPYISSTGINNGIDGFVNNKEKVRIFSNCLSVANSGSIGACFYHPFNFVASDHVTKLENSELHKYTLLFISAIVSKISEKYSFNREINDKRIKNEKILLPINGKGEPDYVFMENYMKMLESKKLKKYIKYKQENL